jgi:LPS-assembly lipoprotein
MIAAMLFLASCGFSPVYEKKYYGDMSESTSQIAIASVKGYDGPPGVDLRNLLRDRLTPKGKPANPRYTLDITMSQPSITDYTIQDDGTASSYLVRIRADYELKDKSSLSPLVKKTASSEISYNILKDQYSTEMLKTGAIKMIIQSLADQIYISVITYFAEK